MYRSLLLACTTGAVFATRAHAQAPVPVVTLPPAAAKSAIKFEVFTGIRMAADGSVLVNNARARQITLLDSTLTKVTVVVDSADGGDNSYGMMPSKLVPYLGDSSLFADANSQTILLRDARGKVIRAIAPPADVPFGLIHGAMLVGPGGADSKGRLIFGGGVGMNDDSSYILRADFNARKLDTLGRFKARDGGRQIIDTTDPGKLKVTVTVNPLPALDSWGVLSDGSVAMVRGHDYHIDWIHADGTKSSSPKMPFDWRRLTDEDKQRLVDSSKAAQAALSAARGGGGGGRGGGSADGGGARGGGAGRSGDPAGGPPLKTEFTTVYLPLKEIADYYPPLRGGTVSVTPDRDGNVWILPTTSAQSQSGELVYDVVNTKGDLFERVRLPAGRALVGFGRGGVVYLSVGDRANGFYLERTRLPGGAAKAPK